MTQDAVWAPGLGQSRRCDPRVPEAILRTAWASATARFLVPLEIFSGQAYIRGSLSADQAGPLTRCRIRASAHMGVRTEQLAPGVGSRHYKIAIPLAGTTVVSQHGRSVTLRPGEVALYDTSEPYSVGSNQPFDLLIVLVPHEVLELRPSQVARVAAAPICGEVITDIRSVLNGVNPQNGACEQAVNRLAHVAARMRPPQRPPREAESLREMAIALASARLHDEGLTPDYLAGMAGVSRRTLYAAFSQNGTTIAATIRQMRLERARVLLGNRETNRMTVTEIATDCGFPDLAHFSRLFRNTYGCSPSRVTSAEVLTWPDRPVR